MTWTIMKHAIMMVEIVVVHLQTNAFVLTANVFVSHMKHEKLLHVIEKSCFWILDFTCSIDADCHQGYCEDQKCVCLPGHAYKEDCSVGGCEYDG